MSIWVVTIIVYHAYLSQLHLTVSSPHSWSGQKKSLLTWQSEFIPLLSAAAALKMSSRKRSCSKYPVRERETIDRIRSKRSKIEKKFRPKIKLKKFRISTRRSKRSRKSWKRSNQSWSRRHQLCSRQISFSGTPCFTQRQETQCHGQKNHANVRFRFRCSHWTGNLASNVNSLCGFSENENCVTPQADHVTGGVECREVKGCHSAAVLSLAGTHHLKVRSGQFREDLRHCQDHPRSPECQRKPGSVPQSQYQRFYIMVSSSRTSDQLLQNCSARGPQAHLSVRSVREDRDQFLQEGQRQRSEIKRTKRQRIKRVLKFPESEG